jgi:glucans biosynthesis protein
MDRRDFLATALALGAGAFSSGGRAFAAPVSSSNSATDQTKASGSLQFGAQKPFSYDLLRARAQALAAKPYRSEPTQAAELIKSIDFDLNQKIQFKPQYSLWPQGPGDFPIRFFHLNRYVEQPVRIHVVSGTQSREILYSPSYFDYGGTGLESKLPADLGFAGFRVMNAPGEDADWLAFQGASYFRSSGDENQYGASARGIAIDTAMPRPEEFPRFTEFWLTEPQGSHAVTIYALLDGPSISGAYRIDAEHAKGAIMTIHADLFPRDPIERLGVAPLTSMFWYGENNSARRKDWRPEIHDSDGLALWTGKGERIWRPLNDPMQVQTNSFVDTNPKGFGLMQRDRDFDDYQDDGAFYNRRPSIWVEPLGAWGDGAVQLVEIPTDDEIHDNIVAYWKPRAPVTRGKPLSFSYRLYWGSEGPHLPSLGRVVATRIGRGGVPGQPPPKDQRKFVIDFQGGPLDDMAQRFDVKPVINLSRGRVKNPYVIKVVGTSRWRAFFDVELKGAEPLDMRCFLRLGKKTLTETWLYQYFPPVA